tara:strand:+ start:173 stop:634 length:462 start_codon:yes stop_codon:yes gene_type:complete
MSLNLKINTNVKNVQARYVKFINKFPAIIKQGVDQAGEQLKTIIVKRTELGKDQDGKKFIAYSPAYAELKGKSTVDLEDTNQMLQSISSKVLSKNKAQVFFRSQREATKGLFHQKGMGNLPKRKFFGFNKRTEKVIQKQFENFVKKEIRRLGI